jgi:hypothetical protein
MAGGRGLLILILALASASGTSAQDDPPCAGPGFERIQSFEGSWEVEWSNRIAPGQFERTTARSQIEPVIPGCALLERFTATVQGSPFWATVLLAATAPDSAQRVWLDSGHGEPLLFQGSWVADTLRFEWARDLGDRRMRLQHLTFAVTPDSFRTATYLSPSEADGWQPVAEAVYRRARDGS